MHLCQILAIIPALTLCAYALPTGDASRAPAAVVKSTLGKRACNAIYRRAAQEDSETTYPPIVMLDCAKLTAGDTAEEDDASILPRDVKG
ncbi:hypothetical protein T440DRAFT_551143 [Plenodomus tracheiphilus IPT5]|uniref:Uncharacterized protein n=1 Tax=Plenodomus tracheiphilus IPT5 TaxID=1408161 RepID=A0A6A7BMZ0_9PLEO|nr:hypothetical protein T440DRAFT_551143 [Plenodomus tracheiphilus IPT5]